MEGLSLPPLPEETFAELLRFAGLGEEEKRRMRLDAERLLEGAAPFIAQVYDHLSRFPPTARALGWEGRVPEEELYLRRAVFGAWMARTIGVDTSSEFARFLYRTGQVHAGHGEKRRHIPPEFVGVSYGLVERYFAERSENPGLWAAYLSAQEEVMRRGYDSARALQEGAFQIRFEALGLAHPHARPVEVGLSLGTVKEAFAKVLVYFPSLREVALEALPAEEEEKGWMETVWVYRLRPRWALLKNGRDVAYLEGWQTPLEAGDRLTLLPPGR